MSSTFVAMQEFTDIEALGLLKQNCEKTLSVLINKYSKSLYHHIYPRVNCSYDAQEIIQNIFISLWKNRQTITIISSLQPYLFKAARYEVINWFIRNKKELIQKSFLSDQISLQATTDDNVFAYELNCFLNQEIAAMPLTMKKIYVLSREQNMTIKEISSLLNLSTQTVKNNISAALKRLKVKYKAYLSIIILLLFYLH